MSFSAQASNQRADGPAEPRPIAAVQHQASAYTRPNHPAPADALLAHITRIRQSRNSGRAYGHTGESSGFSFQIIETTLLGRGVDYSRDSPGRDTLGKLQFRTNLYVGRYKNT